MKYDSTVVASILATLGSEFTRRQAIDAIDNAKQLDTSGYNAFKRFVKENGVARVTRGKYSLDMNYAQVTPIKPSIAPQAAPEPVVEEPKVAPIAQAVAATITAPSVESAIPAVNENYVPFGVAKDLTNIIKSRAFAPVLITGDSGTGKTLAVLQMAAKAKRPVYPVSIDFSTSEDELIGKYVLINGNTVYQKGAVREAMENGGILLLDELDRGNPESLICLNMIMDGYAYTDKKTGELITPAEGFQIIATANTKMQGDDSDRFVAAKVMDEAFVERFPITIEQTYPSLSVEKKIIAKLTDDDFAEKLVRWAQATRKTYEAGAIDNFITTRRLTFIAGKNMLITGGDKLKAIEYGVSRFPAELRDSFIELYKAIDSGAYQDDQESEDITYTEPSF